MTRKTDQNQSMAKSQYPQKCAKNPTQKNVPKTPPRKMCQKPHPEKNRFDWKSQGQIFQESQGQIPRSNPKVK